MNWSDGVRTERIKIRGSELLKGRKNGRRRKEREKNTYFDVQSK
jgi:hypothetical protein